MEKPLGPSIMCVYITVFHTLTLIEWTVKYGKVMPTKKIWEIDNWNIYLALRVVGCKSAFED